MQQPKIPMHCAVLSTYAVPECRERTCLHGIHPFLIWYFFYLNIQGAQVQNVLRNLEGLADVMLQKRRQESTHGAIGFTNDGVPLRQQDALGDACHRVLCQQIIWYCNDDLTMHRQAKQRCETIPFCATMHDLLHSSSLESVTSVKAQGGVASCIYLCWKETSYDTPIPSLVCAIKKDLLLWLSRCFVLLYTATAEALDGCVCKTRKDGDRQNICPDKGRRYMRQ